MFQGHLKSTFSAGVVSCTRSIRLNFCISVQEGPTIPMRQIKHSEHIYIQVMKQHMP